MNELSDQTREQRTVASMLWAAWADALGFITELTDEAGVRRRLHGETLREPVAWTRRIGGRFGAEVRLPAGCYSDDTQLRLATARAISGNGFDVEAFAHVELPVWPAYALGGGRASNEAAANLSRPAVPWYGNFYDGWLDAGGNGVAMRIQPHVWAAAQPATLGPHLLDVIANGVTTHGHPRALVGAVLHALALGYTLEQGETPIPGQWPELLDLTERAVELFDEHQHLSTVWRPSWEKATGTSWVEAWRHTVRECRDLLEPAREVATAIHAASMDDESGYHSAYETLVLSLGLADKRTRGSGTATCIAALALSAGLVTRVQEASLLAARTLGTDTDTIATMAAAIIAATGKAPEIPSTLVDAPYLADEARRCALIARGNTTATFSYPDLLEWQPPRAQIDAVGQADGRIALAGLAWLEPLPGTDVVEGKNANWAWMRADFGASFLVKLRREPRPLPAGSQPVRRGLEATPETRAIQLPPDPSAGTQASLPEMALAGIISARAADPDKARAVRATTDVDVDQLIEWIAQRNFADDRIGIAVRRLAEAGTPEQFISFTSRIRELLRDMPSHARRRVDLLALRPLEFEHLVHELFEAMGFEPSHAGPKSDDDVDALIYRRDPLFSGVYLIEAKRYGHQVPVETVRAMIGSVHEMKAVKGVIVTTSWFGETAHEIAKRAGCIELIDGRGLQALLQRHLGVDAHPRLPDPQHRPTRR